jgi:adenine-specific DNA-methyltransferase
LNELKQLFPEAFEDGVFNLDTLKTLIGDYSTDNNAKEHFGLNWVGKQDARKIAATPPTGTLKPCPGEGMNEDNTKNILIEGENLEVLKILRKSYMGKIKMIYIDPPYNTGTDFIYKDTFADSTEDYLRKTGEKSDEGLLVSNPKSSGKYHANWLSFMYPRLRLAKDLLKEDGVIFISIDDNEIENLRLLCDDIFGEENFIGELPTIMNLKGNPDNFCFTDTHEYTLVYSRAKEQFIPNHFDLNEDELDDWNEDEYGLWKKADTLRRTGQDAARERRPKGFFPIFITKDNLVYATDNDEPNDVSDYKLLPINENGEELSWSWSKNKIRNEWYNLIVVDGRNGLNVYKKQRPQLGELPTKKPKSTFYKPQYSSSTATTILKNLMGAKVFDSPKPIDLIKDFIKIGTNEDDIVLDFFIGSGTTSQAMLELIQDDKISREFIVVQIPDLIDEKSATGKNAIEYLKKIDKPLNISELSKERIRRAIKAVDESQGFKVFKQDASTIYKWQEFVPEKDGAIPDLFSKMELTYKNPLQDGVTTQDFITEVTLQEGFPLTAKQEEVASGIFKITHEWVPYTLYVTMLYSFKNTDFTKLQLKETDHFVCLDKAFEGNDALKQQLDNQCKLYTI